MKVLTTLGSIFNRKMDRLNKQLQLQHCIELSDDYIVKLAKKYKELTINLREIKRERDNIKCKCCSTSDTTLVETYKTHIEVLDKTVEKIENSLKIIKNKIENFEHEKQLLIAKKNLLDACIEVKKISGNKIDNDDFDITNIISEIDKHISEVECEIDINEELNKILNH